MLFFFFILLSSLRLCVCKYFFIYRIVVCRIKLWLKWFSLLWLFYHCKQKSSTWILKKHSERHFILEFEWVWVPSNSSLERSVLRLQDRNKDTIDIDRYRYRFSYRYRFIFDIFISKLKYVGDYAPIYCQFINITHTITPLEKLFWL